MERSNTTRRGGRKKIIRVAVIPAYVLEPIRIEEWEVRDGTCLDLLYKAIGCEMVEAATSPDGEVVAYFDEEGLFKHPVILNTRASALLVFMGHPYVQYVGNAVVMGGKDSRGRYDGRSHSIPARAIEFVESFNNMSARAAEGGVS